ncbi:caveolin-3 [Brachionus plicatilis]|uniref:Caveolin n=1 Tax=Brachionus plicatilis TaxID=10195 RepID=A0A3M7SAF6_BRAPC|nr:caveolin-3 [Brachionus plicatilis]
MSRFDLIERDPKKINNFVQIFFSDVVAEPEFTRSEDTLWSASIELFKCSKNSVYKLFSAVFSIVWSLFCGCCLGLSAFYNVWLWMPCIKYQSFLLRFFKKLNSILLAVCLAPITSVLGLYLSKIGSGSEDDRTPRRFSIQLERIFLPERNSTNLSSKSSTQTKAEFLRNEQENFFN